MNILLTGSSGRIGQELVGVLRTKGHSVRTLGRDSEENQCHDSKWTLGLSPNPIVFEDIDILIHLAWITDSRMPSAQHINVGGSSKLIESALRAKVKTVFISSFAANNPKSDYGAAKYMVEKVNHSGINIRVPLVVDSIVQQNGKNSRGFISIRFFPSARSLSVDIASLREVCIGIESSLVSEDVLISLNSKKISLTDYINIYLGLRAFEIKLSYINWVMSFLARSKSAKSTMIRDRWVSLISSSEVS